MMSEDTKNTDYWEKSYHEQRRQSAANLKLAAERGSQVAELQRELGEAKAELAAARAAYARLMDYRGKNTLNFQLEKLDDYLRVLGSALQERHS